MFNVTLFCRNLIGVTSPFLYATQRNVLGEMLQKERTAVNVNQAMNEIAKAHAINANAKIFPETQELVSASSFLDSRSFGVTISKFINEKNTKVAFFDLLLANASDLQIYDALKLAVKNEDLQSVEKILPFLKNKEKSFDQLFTDLRNTAKFSLDLIKTLLPHCSRTVQKRYLKEMIIQDHIEAVKVILTFCETDQDHYELEALQHAPKISNEPKQVACLRNSSLVNFFDGFQSAKEIGRAVLLKAIQYVYRAPLGSQEKILLLEENRCIEPLLDAERHVLPNSSKNQEQGEQTSGYSGARRVFGTGLLTTSLLNLMSDEKMANIDPEEVDIPDPDPILELRSDEMITSAEFEEIDVPNQEVTESEIIEKEVQAGVVKLIENLFLESEEKQEPVVELSVLEDPIPTFMQEISTSLPIVELEIENLTAVTELAAPAPHIAKPPKANFYAETLKRMQDDARLDVWKRIDIF